MTKFVTLMNPRPRRAARRVRRLRMRRNRLGRFTRRSSIRRRRRVVAQAVVHANPRPRSMRRRRIYRAHRAHRNPPAMTPARRAKISRAIRAAHRRGIYRHSRPSRSVTVVSRRRRSGGLRRSSFGGGSLVSSFKSALSKPLLMKAGGAVVASIGTGYILNRWGDSLPLAGNKYGRMVYTLGLPVLGAYLVRKKNRDLAEGLVIGGLVMTINGLMQSVRAATSAPAAVGAYSVAGELGQGGSFGYYPQSINDPHSLGGGNTAFPNSAW